jgi:hypothetical protein
VASVAAQWRRTWGERRPSRRWKPTPHERVGLFILFDAGQGSPGAGIDAEVVVPRFKGERLAHYVWRLVDRDLLVTGCRDGKVFVALPDERGAN